VHQPVLLRLKQTLPGFRVDPVGREIQLLRVPLGLLVFPSHPWLPLIPEGLEVRQNLTPNGKKRIAVEISLTITATEYLRFPTMLHRKLNTQTRQSSKKWKTFTLPDKITLIQD